MAPSTLAASISESGTPLIAADKMTVEMPAEAQMNTMINRKVLNPGAVAGGLMPPKPRSSNHSWSPLPPMLDGRPGIDLVIWFSRPTLNGGLAYTKRQMMPAPASEMAAGMNTSDLATFSPFMPSANRAMDSAKIGGGGGADDHPREVVDDRQAGVLAGEDLAVVGEPFELRDLRVDVEALVDRAARRAPTSR